MKNGAFRDIVGHSGCEIGNFAGRGRTRNEKSLAPLPDQIDQLARAANVGDGNLAEIVARGWVREASLFGDERHGSRSADRGTERFAGVAIQAAGDVDGEDGNRAIFNGRHDLVEGVRGGLLRPVPKTESMIRSQATVSNSFRSAEVASSFMADTIRQLIRASPLYWPGSAVKRSRISAPRL